MAKEDLAYVIDEYSCASAWESHPVPPRGYIHIFEYMDISRRFYSNKTSLFFLTISKTNPHKSEKFHVFQGSSVIDMPQHQHGEG